MIIDQANHGDEEMTSPTHFADENQEKNLADLFEFLRFPSVSTQPEHRQDVADAAAWLVAQMQDAGLENAQAIETDGHPLVYADWLHAGEAAPTVLIYGHYDVQPVEPLELWESPPFEPEIRDGFIYARGGSDDKGQALIHVKAVEALLKTEGKLPVNVKFLVEGEEESGGASLTAFIPENKEMLAADVALVSDTAMLAPDQPAIVYGLRGMVYTMLDISGPALDLHSGEFGGAIDNPLNVLGHVISNLKDQDGRILIPGFYDDVRSLDPAEREILARNPMTEEQLLAETGAPQSWGEADFTITERLGARPTLDVHGIIGGYTGPGAKTVLPTHVHAKISMRLVPDQDPEIIAALYREYVQQLLPPTVKAEITVRGGAPASISDLNHPAMEAARIASMEVFGNEPIFKRSGGSIPVVGQFQHFLGLETILLGFGLPGDHIHSPNERFYVQNYFNGILTSIQFLEAYGRLGADKQA
jgi:acetylornithine deacetylase/succinyl-diaminopimelate desuccinylase-like protein